MKSFLLVTVCIFWSFQTALKAQIPPTINYTREYNLLFGPINEIEVLSALGISGSKIMQDIYFRSLENKLPEPIRPYSEVAWSVYWTFIFTLWPHEFGHRARAREIGGDFIIHSIGFPFPEAEMKLPASYHPEAGSITSIGGFEVNTLMAYQTRLDVYRKGYAHADELIHGFIQEIYYPFYAFVITPADPNKISTWTDTRGDPVESTLSVYEGFTSRPAIGDNGKVDSELIQYYRENIYMSVLWTLLDPMLYTSARAFGADMKDNRGLMKPWMLGNNRFSWSYGTLFHSSPLGYELYMIQYLKLPNRLVSLYLKWGHPYKNNGLGISMPDLISMKQGRLGMACDLWNQDIFGNGVSVSLNARYRIHKGVGLLFSGYWKNRGYVVGKQIDDAAAVMAGLHMQFIP